MDLEKKVQTNISEEATQRKTQKCEQIKEEIQRLGYTSQNEFLIQNGHRDLKSNLKSLQRFNGDQTQALNDLTIRCKRKDLANKLGQEDETDYSYQNNQLVNKGYTKTERNLKLLRKFKGDLSQVENALIQRRAKKAERQALGTTQQKTICTKSEKCQQYQREIDQLGYTSQNNFLVQNGFQKLQKNLKVLRQVNGDQNAALNVLKVKREQCLQRAKTDKPLTAFTEQNNKLVALGYNNLKRNLKLLNRFQGDYDAVLNKLKRREEKKTQTRVGDQNIKRDIKGVPVQAKEQVSR